MQHKIQKKLICFNYNINFTYHTTRNGEYVPKNTTKNDRQNYSIQYILSIIVLYYPVFVLICIFHMNVIKKLMI